MSQIARTKPEGHFGVARHYAIERVEVTVQITDGTKKHVICVPSTANGKR